MSLGVSSEPGTSEEKTQALHEVLSQAAARSQTARKPTANSTARKENVSHQRIRSHPLFPVLKLLSEKCDQATNSLDSDVFLIDDVEKLIKELESKGLSASTDCSETDRLLWESIILLRTQLAELQKVSILTEEFYNKYISTLKKRLGHETLIGSAAESDDEDVEPSSPEAGIRVGESVATLATAQGLVSIPLSLHHLSSQVTIINKQPNVNTVQPR